MINPFRKIFTKDQVINRLQDNIDNTLKSFISNVLLDGIIQTISITSNTQVIDHKLGRLPIGWIVVGKTSTTDVWVTNLTVQNMTINTTANTTLTLFIF